MISSPASPSIHIRSLEIEYQLSDQLADTGQLQQRLDRVAGDLLAQFWEAELGFSGLDDDAYYFIERLDIQFGLRLGDKIWGSASSDIALAKQWASALQEGLQAAIGAATAARLSDAVIFPGRAEFLAGFLSDLLNGWAWRRWYYREFLPLKVLPLGQAAETLLVREGDTGRDALVVLSRQGELEALFATLDSAQMDRVVAHCIAPPGAPRLALPGAISVWVEALGQARVRLSGEHSRDLARLYFALLVRQPTLGPDTNLAWFLDDLLRLRARLRKTGDRARLFALLAESSALDTYAALDDSGPFLDRLVRTTGAEPVRNLLLELAPGDRPGLEHSLRSNVGGLFLLAPGGAEAGLDEFLTGCCLSHIQGATAGSPSASAKASWLLFLIGLQCLGREVASAAWTDPGLALFAGLAAAPTQADVAAYARSLEPELRATFSAQFQDFRAARHARGVAAGPDEWEDGSPWFSIAAANGEPASETGFLDEGLDTALRPVSAWLLKTFAARLGAFAASSPPYLRRNFLQSQAEIEVYPAHLLVRLTGCSLALVLRMAGFEGEAGTVPWIEQSLGLRGRRLEFRLE